MAAPDREGPVSSSIGLYVEDADAIHARAVAAGASQINPVSDQFHGDRAGSVRDPFGHRWSISPTLRMSSSRRWSGAWRSSLDGGGVASGETPGSTLVNGGQ